MLYNTVSIQYLEKPVTTDETKIASLLERIIKAIVTKNLELLVSVYSDTASIEMLISRGVYLNKSEYEKQMLKIIRSIRNIYFRDTIIRINEQGATISCINSVLLRGRAFPLENQMYFRCIKTGKGWLMIETRYI